MSYEYKPGFLEGWAANACQLIFYALILVIFSLFTWLVVVFMPWWVWSTIVILIVVAFFQTLLEQRRREE